VTRRAFIASLLGVTIGLPAMAGLAAACSPSTTPTPGAPSGAPPAQAEQKTNTSPNVDQPRGRSTTLDEVVEAAKKEGELHWADVFLEQSMEDRFHRAFRKRYSLPDSFTIHHTFKSTGAVVTQIHQEIEAGKVGVDMAWFGDLVFWKGLQDAGALLPYEPSELSALSASARKLNFPTRPPYWYTIATYSFGPVWNKKLVKKEIRSWFDLIDPVLRDLVLFADIRASSSGLDTWKGLKTVVGLEFFERLWETTRPALVTRTPETQQKLASGERGLAVLHLAGRALETWREDSSSEFGTSFPIEGVVALPMQTGILAQAPHPNAARLFAEFMVSQDAAQLLLEQAIWPLRSDVTYPEDVRRFLKPLDQVNVIPQDWENVSSSSREEARAEFAHISGLS
jgi:iron(III) transport system substrate-binding protein